MKKIDEDKKKTVMTNQLKQTKLLSVRMESFSQLCA